jgi:SAM-dependent methyltransferase
LKEQAMNAPRHPAAPYAFGNCAEEVTRLQQLGELLQPSTWQVLQDAGITEGMNVLDVGCGPGSVAFLAADLVGASGSVLGIDRNPAMLASARAHPLASGQPIVSFIQADLAELADETWLEPGFDAIIGRLILLHVADPTMVVRTLTRHLRPGGVMVFQEPDLTRMGASFPPIPLVEQVCERVRDAHRARGIDVQFGLRLQQVFLDAGLPAPRLTCEAFIGSGPEWGWYEQILRAALNALPLVLSSGITAGERAGLDTLAGRSAKRLPASAASPGPLT